MLGDGVVNAVVTSPPYIDARPDCPAFTEWPGLMRELARVCTGGVAINVGRVFRDGEEQLWWLAIREAAKEAGWIHQDTITWIKPNGNPIGGGILANSHELVLLFGHQEADWNLDAARTPYAPETLKRFERRWVNGTSVKGERKEKEGRAPNPLGATPRSFVVVETGREKGIKHPTPMPVLLAEHLVRLSSWEGQAVLDPFFGSGTTAVACRNLNRYSVGIEASEEYCAEAVERLSQQVLF